MSQEPKPKTGNPAGYIPVPVVTLPTLTPIPTHLFIRFTHPKTQVSEMTLWRHAGHSFTDEEIKKTLKSQIREAFLQKTDIPNFKKWWIESGKRLLEERRQINQKPTLKAAESPSTLFGEVPSTEPYTAWDSDTDGSDIDLSIVQAVSNLFAPVKPTHTQAAPPQAGPSSSAKKEDFKSLAQAFESPKPPATPPTPRNHAYDWSHLWKTLLSEKGRSDIPRDLRLKLSKDSAESLIRFSLSAVSPDHQTIAECLIVDTMTYFIHESLTDVAPGLDRLWGRLNSLCPNAHSLRVGSWAVLLALLNGKLHRPLLADLLLAGLSHDIGLSALAARTVLTPMRSHSPSEAQDYSKHVEHSSRILVSQTSSTLAPITKRASKLIQQHHEKFDGRGYPNQLRGFHVEETAQFLCMADLLMTLSEGRWDGVTRTHRESLLLLEKHESAGNFPEFFHPSLFQVLQRVTPRESEADSSDSTGSTQKAGGRVA